VPCFKAGSLYSGVGIIAVSPGGILYACVDTFSEEDSTPETQRVSYQDGGVVAFNPSTGDPISVFAVSDPYAIIFSSDGTTGYVLGGLFDEPPTITVTVTVFSTATFGALNTFTPPFSLATYALPSFALLGNSFYITDWASSNLAVMDAATGTTSTPFPSRTPLLPSRSHLRVWLSSRTFRNHSSINDTVTSTLVATIPLSGTAVALALASRERRILRLMLKPTIFREYDIRGIAETELLSDGIRDLGKAAGTFLVRQGARTCTLGNDCRLSSPRLHDALLEGLLTTGLEVSDLGTVPTPLLYYSVFHLHAAGGVMVTGSHNPAEFNGFKIMAGNATIHGEDIQHLRLLIERQDFETGKGSVAKVDIVTPYVDEIPSQFQFKRRVKVVFDGGNGVAGPVMHRMLQKLNVDAVELFFDMDGRFPNHHPDPTVPANLNALIAAVKEHKAELGVAFDGDSDRIGAVDETGTVIYGDQLMIVYSREILSRKPGAAIIGEVKCSQTLYDDIASRGGRGIMWKTGHSLIKAKMKEEQAELAGEMSGHMFFADRYFGFDDALYAACRLIEIVAESGKPLSYQLADLPRTVSTPELRVDCPDELKFDVVRKVREHFQTRYDTLDVDGARINFAHGWGLVRASNTQPILVLRFEAETPELLQTYRDEVEEVVAAVSGALA
jgi:phosphomannomutase/phosphoglucomutase